MSGCPRYEHEALAWEYDQRVADLAPGELEWYLKYADRSGGPILELACGSGRLLIPIAQAGHEIDGVDISKAMLDRLKDKIRVLDRGLNDRIGLHQSDMLHFTPRRRYSMVFIALNSIQYLETRERFLTCFQRVLDFLRQGGYFLIMVQRVDPSKYAEGRVVVTDWMDEPVVDQERGLAVGSKFVSYIEAGGARVVKERTYRIRQQGAESNVIECVTYSPMLTTSEHTEMLERVGFTVEARGGYREEPENEDSTISCFVCQKGNGGQVGRR